MRAYYNDTEEYVCNWLCNLMAAGLIPEGDVDQRSIRDVTPGDLRGYTQCHFFAGIGGWSRALQLASWPADREVWTGSCPCQPFSVAGKQKGFDDPRHLWPEFQRLIAQRHPATVFGEQVAGKAAWLNLVRSDLEALDYAVGCMPIEAASADADHFRDRYFFVADCAFQPERKQEHGQRPKPRPWPWLVVGGDRVRHDQSGLLAHGDREQSRDDDVQRRRQLSGAGSGIQETQRWSEHSADLPSGAGNWGRGWTEAECRGRGFTAAVANIADRQYIECPDGKWRRLPPPRVRWLGTGIPSRVAKLRAIGNAIDPRPATAFIEAYLGI